MEDTTPNVIHINNVILIPGSSLCSYWKNKVQVIETNLGNFIDSLPDTSYNYKKSNQKNGYDWFQLVGTNINLSDFNTVYDSKINATWIKHNDSSR